MCWTPEPSCSEMNPRRRGAGGGRPVQHHAHAVVFIDEGLALHEAHGICDFLLRQALEIEHAAIEQHPGQHVAMRHRLRNMVDGCERMSLGSSRDGFEIAAPVLAIAANEIKQAAADPADRGNFQLSRPDWLPEQ